ncbi:prepilin-type N-terminal cleavage/methylation domain-containing protein [Geomonas paludis]|uniref:Prepilin-type N-terminal cleavage/methylation domain-containing protein n=1 Tax=Geomonas paludis TaxID=2740185 RepID=A0A6V8MUP3_9BACT|nr:prepilin-type N-terminal cleavage/methylation domain-containing protein [Geomonas paludis]UPU37564.1 prepilin-type N-terminal cleavage/methylation domain-containing protein [Geomonas paludis]GFO63905.1 type IV pilus minor pilin PilW [Geomonas paludis]
MRHWRGRRGYTLVELVVVMLIFAVVMTLISSSFANIVRSTGQLGKKTETEIGGLIGLELMRRDLELAGFGLPYTLPAGLNYAEAPEDLQLVPGHPGAKASNFNDRPALAAPPAYRVGSGVGFNGSDYLVVKGTALGANTVCRSWCYLNYSAVTPPSRVEPELKIGTKARAIVLRTGAGASGQPVRDLVTSGGDFTFFLNRADANFAPRQRTDSHVVYAVANDDGGGDLAFPFNRSDYYINRKSDISALCNPGTGTLYKTTIDHQGGHTKYPILDCAADMQVVFYMDTNRDGKADYHPDPEDGVLTAEYLREELKEIRVYILAQQGREEPGYRYPVADPERAIVVGDPDLPDYVGHVWSAQAMSDTFGAQWRSYRWKLYTIVVQPKNL